MTEAQEQLLSLLSHALFKKTAPVTITDEILAEARAQAVSTLITPDYSILADNIRVINAHAELTGILSDIPFTTFKGFASAFYYPEPVMRPMGDVDFIVDPEKYHDAVMLLEAAGWKRSNTSHDRHEAFRKSGIELELHSEIKGIPNGVDGISTSSTVAEKRVRDLLADLIPTARKVETQQGTVVTPDDFHHGLIMLLHVAGHMINDGGVGLRHLCDWAVYADRVNVERFCPKLETIGLWRFTCQLTAVCTRYLGLSEKTWAGEWPEEFLEAFIEDVLAAGNFGKKEAGRRTVLVLHHSSFAEITRERYPIAENDLLLPIFMIVNLVRYGWLFLTGKRRIIKLSTFTSAKKRDNLYSQFKLFET